MPALHLLLHNNAIAMNRLEVLQALTARINKPGHNLDSLTQIFEVYKALLSEAMADEAYRNGLRRASEELPDLQRLIGKKHDAVLKGRLTDAIRTFRQLAEAAEKAEVPEDPVATGQSIDNPAGTNEQPDNGKHVRNIPTLGMD